MKLRAITVHCSDSPHRGDTAQTVHKWHKERGWAGIGYNEVILETGQVENGRPWFWAGAHVRNFNKGNLGIMLFGKDYFSPQQFNTLEMRIRFYLANHPTIRNVYGHYQLDSRKTCPNFDVPEFLKSRGILASFSDQLYS